MALLPLSPAFATGQPNYMSNTASRWAGIRRLAHKVAAAVAEYYDAMRLTTELNMAPDRYVFHPRTTPDTYAEFLHRTSGPLAHEPSARARADAHR
jgi:hypothetical protein